ncbi:MAG: SpoIVB peptidase S55 domain-containing protein, partial [Thermoanaerobaculia bacterium]
MCRVVLAIILAGLAAASATSLPTEILPAEQVTPGMRGYGLSDLGDGKGVQRFDVEIVGVLKSYAPKQDLILARIENEAIAKTGIIAGMSGSPIYVDGKLVGALAYGWPFARDPICGITPIQSMLDIRKAPPTPPVPIGGAATHTAAMMSAFSTGKFQEPFANLLGSFRGEPAGALPAPLP